MSEQYPGGFITKSPPTPQGPYETDLAYGIWNLSQQAAYKAQGLWPTAGNNPTDAQFNYVTMLLHGDGTNGAQNNTFLDGSSNAFTITRTGNTTQGSFSPYGSNWSNYFDGTNPCELQIANSSAFTLGNAWCLEAWICPSTVSVTQSIMGRWYTPDNNASYVLYLSGSTLRGGVYPNYSAAYSTIPIVAGVWTHVAMTWDGTTTRMFVNGVGVSTGGGANISSDGTAAYFTIGGNNDGSAPMGGYISNARVVKGSAVYTSDFTPSTSPLTAISGTQLLTCQSSRFVDNSSNSFAITSTAGSSVQRFNPFGASTAYSTSTIGGSGYFDGAGDYLQTATSSNFNLGSGNFTIEGWAYISKTGTNGLISSRGSNSVYDGLTIEITSTGMTCLGAGTSSSWDVYLTALIKSSLNSWIHFAVVRNGSTFTMYYNGTSIATTTYAGSMYQTANNFYIGLDADGYMQGYLSDVRITKSAVYTTNFTPNTSPLSAIANTQLLLSMQNGAIYDNAMMNDLETVGNAQISTSVVKYGTGSIAFDGTGDYLTTNAGSIGAFGTGDFTIEMWVYFNNLSDYQYLIDYRPDSTNGAYITLQTLTGTNNIILYANSGNQITSATNSISAGAWIHVALCRASGSTRLFINGTQSGSTYADTTNYLVGPRNPVIAANAYTLGTYCVNGYIDDLRITKGYARYTTTFTPPTSALPNYGPN